MRYSCLFSFVGFVYEFQAIGVNFASIMPLIVVLLSTVVLLFITCEIAERICSKFDEIDDEINQSKWYLFPLEMQQVLPIIMANAQAENYFECFGSIRCNRENFKMVWPVGQSFVIVS